MSRALCLVTSFLLLPNGIASADPGAGLGANAALKYWQAFATLPRLTDSEMQKLGGELLTKPLDEHSREILGKADYALLMLHYGAALQPCDWGIGHEEGIFVRFPQAPAARELSTLACLRARQRFEGGQNAEAVGDLVAAMTLGRHITLAGTNIMLLVGYAIEHQASETLTLYIPRLNAELLKDLKARLAALPSAMSTAKALESEEQFYLQWFVRRVRDAKDKESLLALFGTLESGTEGKRRDAMEEGREFLEACGGTMEGVLKFAEETLSSYKSTLKILELPLDQFNKEFEREKEKQSKNPVWKVFFPALAKVRMAQARNEIRRALLSAALAVQLDGPSALKDYPDPVMGGPFEQAAFEGGFELRSKFTWIDGKPVVLIVGPRGK